MSIRLVSVTEAHVVSPKSRATGMRGRVRRASYRQGIIVFGSEPWIRVHAANRLR